MDVRLGRPCPLPEPESNAPATHNAASRSTRSETHAEPEAEVATSVGTDMEIESSDRRVRLREENTDLPRHTLDASMDRDSTAEPRGEIPRRKEVSEHGVPSRVAEGSPSEPFSKSAAAASDISNGERLHVSTTDEGPSGEYLMTTHRDRHGRWRPTKGERTMMLEKAREARRSFYVEHGTCSIASAEASPLHREFFLSRRNADEVSWNHLSSEERSQFSKAIETEWQGVHDFEAVKIIDPTQADVIREKQRDRVISSRLVLRWKETDIGYKAKARWCVHGLKYPGHPRDRAQLSNARVVVH